MKVKKIYKTSKNKREYSLNYYYNHKKKKEKYNKNNGIIDFISRNYPSKFKKGDLSLTVGQLSDFLKSIHKK